MVLEPWAAPWAPTAFQRWLMSGPIANQIPAAIRCTASTGADRAIRNVRFFTDRHTRKRGGWIEHWVAKPTRQPSRSLPARWHAIVDFGRGHYGPPPASLLAA